VGSQQVAIGCVRVGMLREEEFEWGHSKLPLRVGMFQMGVPVTYTPRCSFLFPLQFNKCIDFYFICLGLEGAMETHEFGRVYFHLKGCGHWALQN